MKILVDDVSKRYTDSWILKNVDYEFAQGVYAVKGPNGSGKSTLLKMISGYLSPTAGTIVYRDKQDRKVIRDQIYQFCAFWGPYISLVGKLKVVEMVDYYYSYKKIINGLSKSVFYQRLGLEHKKETFIESLSSGQVQRLGLALAIMSDSHILLLDEPGAFLDDTSIIWFRGLLHEFTQDRIVVISSNEEKDFPGQLDGTLMIQNYK